MLGLSYLKLLGSKNGLEESEKCLKMDFASPIMRFCAWRCLLLVINDLGKLCNNPE